jgi:site-specific DNA-cytosine methylase
VYASTIRSSIQAPSRRGSAQAVITWVKAASTVMSMRRADWRSDRDTRRPSSGSTPRETGDHQSMPAARLSAGIGKTPCR